MSVRLMSRVWDYNCSGHTQKLVLLALADNANDQGVCWPSIATLSQKCQLSERCVYEQIGHLVKSRLLTVKSGGGTRSNMYQIRLPKPTPERGAGVNAVQGTPEQDAPLPLNTVQGTPERHAGEPSYNHQLTVNEPKSARARLHNIPSSPEEVIAFGSTLNPPVAAETCRDFWAHYEGQARTNANGEVFWITSGEAIVTNWKAKLPSFHGNGGNGKPGGGRPATIMDLRAIQAIKEEKAKALLNRYATETSLSTDWSHEGKRQEWIALRNEIKGLKERIEKMA